MEGQNNTKTVICQVRVRVRTSRDKCEFLMQAKQVVVQKVHASIIMRHRYVCEVTGQMGQNNMKTLLYVKLHVRLG